MQQTVSASPCHSARPCSMAVHPRRQVHRRKPWAARLLHFIGDDALDAGQLLGLQRCRKAAHLERIQLRVAQRAVLRTGTDAPPVNAHLVVPCLHLMQEPGHVRPASNPIRSQCPSR